MVKNPSLLTITTREVLVLWHVSYIREFFKSGINSFSLLTTKKLVTYFLMLKLVSSFVGIQENI